jgi:hypothetical protein
MKRALSWIINRPIKAALFPPLLLCTYAASCTCFSHLRVMRCGVSVPLFVVLGSLFTAYHWVASLFPSFYALFGGVRGFFSALGRSKHGSSTPNVLNRVSSSRQRRPRTASFLVSLVFPSIPPPFVFFSVHCGSCETVRLLEISAVMRFTRSVVVAVQRSTRSSSHANLPLSISLPQVARVLALLFCFSTDSPELCLSVSCLCTYV